VGLFQILKPFAEVEVCIWKIEELDESAFSFFQTGAAFKQRLAEIQHPKRRIEYLASRAALNEIYPESTVYYEGRKPHLTDGSRVSFSHNSQYGAAARSKTHSVGIDLEFGRQEKIEAIKKKFLSDEELTYFNNPITKQLAWGAKEALFKCYGFGMVDFKHELSISPFELREEGYFNGVISKETKKQCKLYYRIWDNQYLVVALAE
jgi:4'-phosphopantetheinyl transferase